MTEKQTNVAHYLPIMAESQPQTCAVMAPECCRNESLITYSQYTFSELENISNGVANYFISSGIEKGTRTLLMVKPGIELIAITFALFKIGAVPVIIDPGMGLKSFLRCVKKTEPNALIGISLAQWVRRIFAKNFASCKINITSGNAKFKQILNDSISNSHENNSFELVDSKSTDLAAILFTSGSTGPPKGVCYEHAMFNFQVELIRRQYSISPGEIDLPMLPIFALFNPALGMTTVIPQMNPSRPAKVDPNKIVQAILQCNVTNSFGSPVLWKKIGRYCMANKIKLPSLKRILIAGAPVSPELIRLYDEILVSGEIHTPYGATECLPVSSISGREILDDTWKNTEQGLGTCLGKVLKENCVKVIAVDDSSIESIDTINELKSGEIGEIIVKGPTVTRSYYNLETETKDAKILDVDGTVWHRIGDLGYIDSEERLWFCGRKAERVQFSDRLYYTDCCEAIFNQHADVFRSALIGLGEFGNQIPAIVIEPEKNKFPKSKNQVTEFTQSLKIIGVKFKHTKNIQKFFFIRNFPVDSRHNAKIHRLSLKKFFDKKVE